MKHTFIIILAGISLFTLSSCRDRLTGPNQTASSDTIAYWTFDGNLKDVTGNGHDGIAFGTPDYYAGNRFGGSSSGTAIDLNSSSWVSVPDKTDLDFTANDSYTISAWVNLSGKVGSNYLAGGVSNIVDKMPSPLIKNQKIQTGYGMYADSGRFSAQILGDGLITLQSNSPVRFGTWHMVTLVVAAHESITLFLDSSAVDSKADTLMQTVVSNNVPLLMGAIPGNSQSDSTSLDDILIVHHAMSGSEVTARFHEGGWYEHADSVNAHDTIHDTTGHIDSTFHWSGPTIMPSGILGMSWVNGSPVGYACGSGGQIWKSTDSGNTWQQIPQTATQGDLYAISFIQNSTNPEQGVAIGYSNGPVIITTTDAGATWTRNKIPPGVAKLNDVNTGVGGQPFSYAVGSDSAGNGIILYSNFWQYWGIARRTPKPLYSLSWDPQDNNLDLTDPLIAVGEAGQIFVANNFEPNPDSLQWTDYSSSSENLRSISLFNFDQYTYAVALTDNGSTLWSTDYGKTWTEHTENVSTYLPNSKIYMAGLAEAWISGSSLARTGDGGLTWSNASPVAGGNWTCICGPSSHHVAFLSGTELYWLTR